MIKAMNVCYCFKISFWVTDLLAVVLTLCLLLLYLLVFTLHSVVPEVNLNLRTLESPPPTAG